MLVDYESGLAWPMHPLKAERTGMWAKPTQRPEELQAEAVEIRKKLYLAEQQRIELTVGLTYPLSTPRPRSHSYTCACD